MSDLFLSRKAQAVLIFKYFTFFHRLQGLEEQYRKEKEEADQLFEQQRKVIWEKHVFLMWWIERLQDLVKHVD